MKVLICGDRNWHNWRVIHEYMEKLPKDTVIVNGGCRGADNISTAIAIELGFKVVIYPAKWKQHGRKAGPIRNIQMLKEERPDIVVAFHNNHMQSKGTKNMLEEAVHRHFRIKVIRESG